MLPYRTACHVYSFGQHLSTPHPWVGSTLGTPSYSEVDPWCPDVHCFLRPGYLLNATPWQLAGGPLGVYPGAYPVPHHTPCAFSPTSYIATEPTWTRGEGGLSDNNPIPNTWVPHYTALGCIHCSWEDDRARAWGRTLECRTCSLPQPKGKASCTTKGISGIGTFQPRSSDISSWSLTWQLTHRRYYFSCINWWKRHKELKCHHICHDLTIQ